MSILNKKPSLLLDEFLSDYNYLFKIDIHQVKNEITNTIKYYNGDSVSCKTSMLEKNWYESLAQNNPLYSIYSDEFYFIDVWCCWKMYSRSYIKILKSKTSLINELIKTSKSVIDLGNGIGYSTASLKEIFINCDVYGFNFKKSKQYEFSEYISEKYGFNMISDFSKIDSCDIVFASEYFEHFERPIEHLQEIVEKLSPKHLIIANSFNTKSMGHFIDYKHNDETVNQKDISRLFNRSILALGFNKINANIFNKKPSIYSINKFKHGTI
jgi:SAM-dependent methyltransferase